MNTTRSMTAPLPDGLYIAVISNAFLAKTSSDVENLALRFEIQTEAYKDTVVWKNLYFHTDCARKHLVKELKRIGVAIKNRAEMAAKLDTFIGASVVIALKNGTAYLVGLNERSEPSPVTDTEPEDWTLDEAEAS